MDSLGRSPTLHITLEIKYHVSPIATMRRPRFMSDQAVFGGVIFTRSDRTDVKTLADIRGRRFVAVDESSLGGFLIARGVLENIGIHPYRDFSSLAYAGTHRAAVLAVLNNKADAGTARTDTLEGMAAEGLIDIKDIHVFPASETTPGKATFPFLLSTPLYPEWPMAKAESTDDALARSVAAALFVLPPDSLAAKAADIAGWTVPRSYQVVENLLRDLRVGPFKNYGRVSLTEALRQHIDTVVLAVFLFIVLAAATIILWDYNRKLKRYRHRLLDEMAERERISQEIARSNSEITQIFNTAAGGMRVIDLDCNVIKVNDAYLTLTGYSREEVEGHKCHETFSGPSCGTNDCTIARMLSGEKRLEFEVEKSRKDGRIIYCVLTTTPYVSSEGKLLGVIEDFRDITERKQAEEALKESETRIRRITDTAQDAILMMGPDGQVTFWNPAAEHMFGYSSNEAIGQDLHALITPKRYHESFQSAFHRFRLTGQGDAIGKTIDLFARRKDEEEIAVSLTLSALIIQGDWHAVGILRDITERKRVEKKLNEFAQQVELKNLELDSALSQAQSATQAKGEFLANMSHEIRTPMNGVIGMTELLLDTELTVEQRRYADTIRASGDSLLCLINDILDFSKIEAGKLELETLDFNLLSLLDDITDTLAGRAQEKELELLCHVDPEVPGLLQGDPSRLRQILNNLISNAIKFTHRGEVVLRVSTVEELATECMLCFSIRDTGIGIPEDKVGVLFEKFSQVDASTTRQYGGTGLGLAISKQLAEMMGGEIGINSQEGRGSEFWFTVRLGRQPEEAQTKTSPPANLRDVHVLIVDDNATNCEILNMRMSIWGMRPFEVLDGQGALQALNRAVEENDPFKIAVIDMQMPGMDGESLGRAIKANSRFADTHMMMLTSMGMRGDAQRFEEIGFEAFATKPVRHRELFNMLSTVLTSTSGSEKKPLVTRHSAREILEPFSDKERILLAEDNITNQQVALGILKKFGLKADVVLNGEEVIKALSSFPYDLVLMDVQMPVMNGYEATRNIRDPNSKDLKHNIPIIAMTAHAMKGDREKCLEAGMDDYVSKPVSPHTLAETLAKWLPKKNPEEKEQLPRESNGATSVLAPEGEIETIIFDELALMHRMMDDEEMARTIAQGFLGDIPKQIAVLKECLKTLDVQGAERVAHSIKGASATVGGEALRSQSLQMENFGKAGDVDALEAQLPELERQFALLKKVMEKHFL